MKVVTPKNIPEVPATFCGTPTGIADTLEKWFVEGAADGYNILPAYFPGAFADFVDLVVPELQHRGLLRRDYEGRTLRDHLRLPPAPARLRQAAGAEYPERSATTRFSSPPGPGRG